MINKIKTIIKKNTEIFALSILVLVTVISTNYYNYNKNKILKEYGVGAQILIDLGVKKIILLANSSKNIVGIDGFGLEINGTKKI